MNLWLSYFLQVHAGSRKSRIPIYDFINWSYTVGWPKTSISDLATTVLQASIYYKPKYIWHEVRLISFSFHKVLLIRFTKEPLIIYDKILILTWASLVESEILAWIQFEYNKISPELWIYWV